MHYCCSSPWRVLGQWVKVQSDQFIKQGSNYTPDDFTWRPARLEYAMDVSLEA
jgi:hypothetical protein